jgi:hypothetical protein
MQKLYEITIPGLSMKVDLPAVRHRLRADFPQVVEVLEMTTPATLLIAYHGEQAVDAWLDAISESVATRRSGFRGGLVCRTTDTPSAA